MLLTIAALLAPILFIPMVNVMNGIKVEANAIIKIIPQTSKLSGT